MATDPSMGSSEHSRMLIAKYALLNVIGIVGLFYAWQAGVIGQILAVDTIYISELIFGLFLVGDILAGWHLVRAGAEIDQIRKAGSSERLELYAKLLSKTTDHAAIREALATRMDWRIEYLRKLSVTIAEIGLAGTMYLLFVALLVAGVAISQMAGIDVKQLQAVLGPAMSHMGVAIVATFDGIVFSMWLGWLVHLLSSGTALLYARIIEQGALRATPTRSG